jgi:hypothetical protein
VLVFWRAIVDFCYSVLVPLLALLHRCFLASVCFFLFYFILSAHASIYSFLMSFKFGLTVYYVASL